MMVTGQKPYPTHCHDVIVSGDHTADYIYSSLLHTEVSIFVFPLEDDH